MPPIFLHLPKTAGSSVRTLITLNYRTNEVASVYGDHRQVFDQLAALIGKTSDYKLIQGHFPYGAHLNLGLKSARYFSFLRDPVLRHFSDVAHGLRDNSHGFHTMLSLHKNDPMALAKMADHAIYFRNTATHYLSGLFFTRDVDLADFHRAAETVLHSEFVGLAERFDESVLIMARKLGWDSVVYEKRNVASESTSATISPEVRRACEYRLSYDMALYRIAQERFEEEANSYGSQLREATHELAELVALQSQQNPNLEHLEYRVGEPVQVKPGLKPLRRTDSPLARWLKPKSQGKIVQTLETASV